MIPVREKSGGIGTGGARHERVAQDLVGDPVPPGAGGRGSCSGLRARPRALLLVVVTPQM